jgi:hypothetical protein
MAEWPSAPSVHELILLDRRLAEFLESELVAQMWEHLNVLGELERSGATVTALRSWYVEFYAQRESAIWLMVKGVPGAVVPVGGHPVSVTAAVENLLEIAEVVEVYKEWRSLIGELLDAPQYLGRWDEICAAMTPKRRDAVVAGSTPKAFELTS